MRAAQCTLFSLLFASTNVTFADWTFNLTPGVTPLSHDIYALHMIIFWICAGIGSIVFSVMIYTLIHHRKSKGRIPAQFHEHLGIELVWFIIPLFILVVMAIPATQVLTHIRNTEHSDLTIQITGFQWKWHYRYLDQDIRFFSNNTTPFAEIYQKKPKNPLYLRMVDHPLVLPIHKKIRFLVTSNDVIHSWWVQALGVKQDAVPGFIIEAWTTINRPGTYYGQCAELCGMNHAYMSIVVEAVSEKDFEKWIMQQKTGILPQTAPTQGPTPVTAPPLETPQPATPSVTQNQQGETIYMTICAACHQVTGEGLPPTYPALKGSKIVGGDIPHHLNRVIFGKPGTAMQAFKDQLSDEEIAAVVTYERHQWGHQEIISKDQVAAQKAKGPLPEG